MKKSRFTETQIVSILKEVEAGLKVDQVCRNHGISSATYYNWKSKYGGMKTEKLYREQYKTRYEAKAAVFDYIEGFYNPHSRHSTLGNISPAAYEKMALRA